MNRLTYIPQIPAVRDARRRVFITFILVMGLFSVIPVVLSAQTIEIVKLQDLMFGTLSRDETKVVAYSSPEAGIFEVRGESRKKLKIEVSIFAPGDAQAQVAMTIRPSDIAYSRDGGVSWTECTSATLSWTTQFPRTTGGVQATILVRVGATLITNSSQKRGDYRGIVRLKASYI